MTHFHPFSGAFSENDEFGGETSEPIFRKSFTLSSYMTKLRRTSQDMTFAENV
jgi:hypothetical protein